VNLNNIQKNYSNQKSYDNINIKHSKTRNKNKNSSFLNDQYFSSINNHLDIDKAVQDNN